MSDHLTSPKMSKVEDIETSDDSSESITSESEIDEKIDGKLGEGSAMKRRGRPKKPMVTTVPLTKKTKKGI